jgi:P27 family predicted phage terminase small subunit
MKNIRDEWSDETKEYIKEVNNTLTNMGVLESVDMKNIVLLGDAYDMYLQAKDNVRQQGLTIGHGDRERQNPNLVIARQQQAMVLSYLKELNITCRGRRLLANSEMKADETPLSAFLDLCKEE